MRHISVAIDGPAGAGKSTVAKLVSDQLSFLYIDTGAMYRAVAWLALSRGANLSSEQDIVNLLLQEEIRFEKNDVNRLTCYVNGASVTDELRTPEVSEVVSVISVYGDVRRILTGWQQEFASRYSVVMDGRDVGTVVLPNADVKVYLDADVVERARRRKEEFSERGYEVALEELVSQIRVRDARDASRKIAPLKKAEDAVVIDTTGRSISDIVLEIVELTNRVVQ